MDEILDETLEMLGAGRAFALVKLIADQGSTPRAAGAEMLVRSDGSIAGTIGGGLLEHTMMQAATGGARRAVLAPGADGAERYRREQRRHDAVRRRRGGADHVRAAGRRRAARGVRGAARGARRGASRLALDRPAARRGRTAWTTALLEADGLCTGAAVCGAPEVRALTGGAAQHGTASLPDGRSVVVERLDPPALAVVCGGGHVGRALAPVLLGLGFRVVVVDDREEFAGPRGSPGRRWSPAVRGRTGGCGRGRARLRRDRHPRPRPRHGRARAGPAHRRGTSASWPAAASARSMVAALRERGSTTTPSPASTRPSASPSAPRRRRSWP